MFDFTHLLQVGGLVLLGVFLFSEVGLFLGFFLPGDTLLIAAGIFAKQGHFSIFAVIIVAAIAAIAGDSTSYYIGRRFGRRIFRKEDSVIFRKDHIQWAEHFYERHGSKTLLVAHFFPVIRTFSPPLAGVGKMHYPKFLGFDAIGDTLWALVVGLAGYYLGSRIPHIDHYIWAALGLVILVSLVPTVYQFGKFYFKKRARRRGKIESER